MPMAPPLVDLLVKQFNSTHRAFVGQKPAPSAMMPTGNSDDREFVQNSAVGLTMIGMVVLIFEVVRKS